MGWGSRGALHRCNGRSGSRLTSSFEDSQEMVASAAIFVVPGPKNGRITLRFLGKVAPEILISEETYGPV